MHSSLISPTSGQDYDDQIYENYRQHYANMSTDNYQLQQSQQQLLHLSLGKEKLKIIFTYFKNSYNF